MPTVAPGNNATASTTRIIILYNVSVSHTTPPHGIPAEARHSTSTPPAIIGGNSSAAGILVSRNATGKVWKYHAASGAVPATAATDTPTHCESVLSHARRVSTVSISANISSDATAANDS